MAGHADGRARCDRGLTQLHWIPLRVLQKDTTLSGSRDGVATQADARTLQPLDLPREILDVE